MMDRPQLDVERQRTPVLVTLYHCDIFESALDRRQVIRFARYASFHSGSPLLLTQSTGANRPLFAASHISDL